MLEKADRDEAVAYNHTVLSNLKQTPNYTGLVESNRFFVGACGEIAFRKWAIMKGLRFDETGRDDGESDKQDFILYAKKSGRPCTINVKCSLHPNAHYLMQPKSQHMIHKQDMYIGATGEDDGVRVAIILAGAVTRKVFDEKGEECMVKIQTLRVPLDDLTYSMERIANSFERR
jgi:hypothetical protein